MVLDLFHAVDSAENFLSHLLLEEAADRALKHDAAAGGFETKFASCKIRVGGDGVVDSFGQARAGCRHEVHLKGGPSCKNHAGGAVQGRFATHLAC